MKFDIPPFSNGYWIKNCKTVGEVVDELSRLPRDLPIESIWEKSIDIVVFNRKEQNPFVGFEEGGDWDEEAKNGY